MNKYALSLGLRTYVAPRESRRIGVRVRPLHGILIVLGVLLVGLYVFLVNNTTASGYRMREIEKYIETIRTENKQFELQLAERQSMEAINTRLGDAGFVPVARIDYLAPGVPAVALK